MAGYIKLKDIPAIYIVKLSCTAVYKGAVLLWEAALRIWKGRQIWKGKEKWKH